MQAYSGLFRPGLALCVGVVIGYGFGLIQYAARHNEPVGQGGKTKSGWGIKPQSAAMMAYLLIAIIIIPAVCPMLFATGTQWWVTGGLGVGYGAVLFRQLHRRRMQRW